MLLTAIRDYDVALIVLECTSLPLVGDIVSALGLCYNWVPKSSYEKYRFTVFHHCLRTAAVLAMLIKIHTSIYVPYIYVSVMLEYEKQLAFSRVALM